MPLEKKITEIEYSSRFLRSFGRIPTDTQNKAREHEVIFRKNAFDPRLHTHKLHGKRMGEWSYNVDYEYRVVFVFRRGDAVLYLNVGTHDELYH